MSIPIDHLIHSSRKTIALIIQQDGELTVRAPLRMSPGHIQEFVQNHAGWIRKKQAQMKALPSFTEKHFIGGEHFLYLGKEYPLTILAHQRPALTFNGHAFYLANSHVSSARQAFTRWYKVQALRVMTERLAIRAKQNNYSYQKIRISSARTRWGSCSTHGTLSFTWRLVLAPPEIVDYVIVHELVHTKIRNHSKTFWQKVGEIIPEFKSFVRWLNQNGKYLALQEKTP